MKIDALKRPVAKLIEFFLDKQKVRWKAHDDGFPWFEVWTMNGGKLVVECDRDFTSWKVSISEIGEDAKTTIETIDLKDNGSSEKFKGTVRDYNCDKKNLKLECSKCHAKAPYGVCPSGWSAVGHIWACPSCIPLDKWCVLNNSEARAILLAINVMAHNDGIKLEDVISRCNKYKMNHIGDESVASLISKLQETARGSKHYSDETVGDINQPVLPARR